MTDPFEAPAKPALPHDGWGSRKIIIAGALLAVLVSIATYALFSETGSGGAYASFDQWSGFMQLLVPSVLVPLFGALGLDKVAEAKRLP